MKKLLSTILFCGVCLLGRAQTHLAFDLSTLVSAPTTNRAVWLTPMSTPTVSGSSVVTGDKYITNSGSGIFTVSNVVVGLYYVQVKAPPSETAFKVLVTSTNLGTVQVARSLAADSLATFPAGLVAWAAASSDSRYMASPTNSGVDGQVPIKSGDKSKWFTVTGLGDVTQIGQNNFTGSNNFSLAAALTLACPFFIPTGAVSNYVWTCTNTATGQGAWLAQLPGMDTNAVRANAIAAVKTNQNNFTGSNNFAGQTHFGDIVIFGGPPGNNVTVGTTGTLGVDNTLSAHDISVGGERDLFNNDGSGVLAGNTINWDVNGNLTAATFTGSGPGLTGLNASGLSSGTVADVRLSGNVPLKGSVNVFTQSNSIAGAFTGNAIGLTNGGPGLATNSATATDGQVLKKTGNRLAFVTVTGVGDVVAAGDNAFTGSNSMSGPLTFPNTGSPGIFILQGDGDGDLVLTNRGGSNGSFLFSDDGWFSANGPIISYDYISASNGFYGKFIGDGSALSQGNASTFFSTGTLPGSVIPAFSGAATNAAGSTTLALQDHDHTSHTKGGPISLTGAAFANQGTAATVLHGNASGNPSFGAVRLDTDVTGNLPVANLNGGVNANSATTWFGDGTWKTPSSAAVTGEWHTNGNDAQASGFIGTTNASELRFRENNVQVAKFNSTNGIVIGAANDIIGANFSGTPAGIFAPAGGNTNFSSGGSVILGGTGNQIHTNGNAFIGGGSGNKIYVESPGNDANAIVGGIGNKIDTNCGTAFIGGGNGNRVSTNGLSAVIGGGVNNQAAGLSATVPGGNGNRAFGNYSFVAGVQGRANNAGSFVWSDTQGTAVDSAADQFVVNARGGVFLNGKLTSDASGLTNGSPGLATNSATATDGQVLVKRGSNLNLETVSGLGGGGPFTNLNAWANGDYAITAHGGFENTNVSTGWKIVGTNYQFGIIATNTSQSPSNSFQVDTPQQSKAFQIDTNGTAYIGGAGTNTFVAGNLSAYNLNVTNDVNATNNLRVGGTLAVTGAAVFNNASNYMSGYLAAPQVLFSTNSGSALTPDFSKAGTYLTTNAAFTILSPVNANLTNFETTTFCVTNSTAAGVAISTTGISANTKVGTFYVTNLTMITYSHWGGLWTNVVSLPIF